MSENQLSVESKISIAENSVYKTGRKVILGAGGVALFFALLMVPAAIYAASSNQFFLYLLVPAPAGLVLTTMVLTGNILEYVEARLGLQNLRNNA